MTLSTTLDCVLQHHAHKTIVLLLLILMRKAWLKLGVGLGVATGWANWSMSCSPIKRLHCWVSTLFLPNPMKAPVWQDSQNWPKTNLKTKQVLRSAFAQLQPELDFDGAFARALEKKPIVLGYYLSSERDARTSGVLPQPAITTSALQGRTLRATSWTGYGSNIESLAKAAPVAGFFNSITDGDGVVRSLPLIAEFKGQYYESLGLAMFRALAGFPAVVPGFSQERFLSRSYQGLDRILLKQGDKSLAIPVDERVATLVPFRGKGGVTGGSFKYISATDILAKRIPPESLKDKIILVGTTAPGLLDLRVTPVGETYPGVETHANLISGLLDGKVLLKPDYALGYEVVTLTIAGLILALGLPIVRALVAVGLSLTVVAVLVLINFWLYLSYGLVLPLASGLTMALTAFALNMSYGYFVESKSKRELANLFGTYVPSGTGR